MLDLFYYTVSSIGLMCILKYGNILSLPRDFLTSKSKYLKELFSCSLCLGFWAGVAIACFIYFILDSWEDKYFLFPLYSSISCWIADPVIGIFSYTENLVAKKANE